MYSKLKKRSIISFVLVMSLVASCILNNSVSMAKKYYSLKKVGIKKYYYSYDIEVVSLKGKTLTYDEVYRVTEIQETRVRKKAKITNKTKYYIGDAERFVEKGGYNNQADSVNVKWLNKVSKKKFFKSLTRDNYNYAVICVKNGKIVSIVTNVILAG